MLVLLFGTHLFLTIRLKFIQKHTWTAIKLSVSKDTSGEGDVSQFGALTTALAATIGTGNIVGVATAVGLGGPGAVLWCWLTGVFGMATKYAEALLSVKYRVKTSDGTMLGGPMYALENGMNSKWLAVLFCIFTSIAAFGIGNTVQANSIAVMVKETMGVSPHLRNVGPLYGDFLCHWLRHYFGDQFQPANAGCVADLFRGVHAAGRRRRICRSFGDHGHALWSSAGAVFQ